MYALLLVFMSALTGQAFIVMKTGSCWCRRGDCHYDDDEGKVAIKCWSGIRLETPLILISTVREMRKSWFSVSGFGKPLMSKRDVGLSTRGNLMNASTAISHDVICFLLRAPTHARNTLQTLKYLLQPLPKTRSGSVCSDHWNIFKY